MHAAVATITVGIPPTFHLGPVEVAWHGLTIVLGIIAGGVMAGRWARRLGIAIDPLYTIAGLLSVSGLIGGRLFYLLEHGLIDEPARWLSTTGFTFDGGFIAAALAIAIYLRRAQLGAVYVDVVAAALPLGVAVGRIGDIINGEHYGAPTTFFLGVRNSNPEALTPRHDIAYHNGGLYEVILALTIFAIVWPLRHRLIRHATAIMWSVVALFSVGRFLEFFLRDDSPTTELGLSTAQWTSAALLVVSGVGAWLTLGRRRDRRQRAASPAATAAVPAGGGRRSSPRSAGSAPR